RIVLVWINVFSNIFFMPFIKKVILRCSWALWINKPGICNALTEEMGRNKKNVESLLQNWV
ncbi:MAG TPA: hypothetical protein PKC54_12925, partial [Ferruginibacter sp.]|nr:hypothetical protein [Ferruginibacter sp.]